ncbi:hypothetical protein CDIK_2792 [Cucumispora dikerogammari]|nr:hypothetical protein CDIK_2792 [Cucumispora dikerogammari]
MKPSTNIKSILYNTPVIIVISTALLLLATHYFVSLIQLKKLLEINFKRIERDAGIYPKAVANQKKILQMYVTEYSMFLRQNYDKIFKSKKEEIEKKLSY